MVLTTDLHILVSKRLLRYVSDTLQFGLTLQNYKVLDLIGFYDANYASLLDDRRNTSAYYVYLNESLISWHISN